MEVAVAEEFSSIIAGLQVTCEEQAVNESKDCPIRVYVNGDNRPLDASYIIRLVRKLVMESHRGYFMEQLDFVVFSDAPFAGVLEHAEKSDLTLEGVCQVLRKLAQEIPNALPANQLRMEIQRIINENCSRVPSSL